MTKRKNKKIIQCLKHPERRFAQVLNALLEMPFRIKSDVIIHFSPITGQNNTGKRNNGKENNTNWH